MTKCPRFKFCSVNICLLDDQVHLRNKLDGEPRCEVAKSIRFKIGTECGLLKLGLTSKEYVGYKKWQEKSEEDKDKIKELLARSAFRK